MGNPLQDQLLKAGVVSKQQVKSAKKTQHKKNRQHIKNNPVDENPKLSVQQAIKEKAIHDKELNRKKVEDARKKAVSIEIDQLILNHCLQRKDDCDIPYQFQHKDKIKQILVSAGMKHKIIEGYLGIASINDRFELVSRPVAEKIQGRDETRIILIVSNVDNNTDDDYADYQIPDDLTW